MTGDDTILLNEKNQGKRIFIQSVCGRSVQEKRIFAYIMAVYGGI